MGCADTIRTGVTPTNDEDILATSSDALVLAIFYACQHSVLLRKKLQSQVNTFQCSARDIEVTGSGGTSGEDDGGELLCKLRQYRSIRDSFAITKRYALLLQEPNATVNDGLV